jgi:HlyD family secretion protein
VETAYQVATATLKAATRRVEQAQASLQVIRVQLEKLTASSPVAGVVAARNAEVGEIAKPGASILTVTDLNEVTLTAYIPEGKIGLVKLGQKALVSVDSYPDDSFTGEVIFISPRALFTPGNIQLKEEREKTVFAIKIRLDNREQKLKPGMSADARIMIGP